eukprot:SAG31_NODE_1131_length_9748_cov_3.466473_2_plen_144_part_00
MAPQLDDYDADTLFDELERRFAPQMAAARLRRAARRQMQEKAKAAEKAAAEAAEKVAEEEAAAEKAAAQVGEKVVEEEAGENAAAEADVAKDGEGEAVVATGTDPSAAANDTPCELRNVVEDDADEANVERGIEVNVDKTATA